MLFTSILKQSHLSDEHSKGVFLQTRDGEEDLKADFCSIHSFFLHGFLHP